MPRGNLKIRKVALSPDITYGSLSISKFINYTMLNGKKTVATRIVYDAFQKASEATKVTPEEMFEAVLRNVGPILEVKSKRIGGANYQIPMEVSRERRNTLAMKWIIDSARHQKGRKMSEKLSSELVDAFHNQGAAIKKREETHRMAEANKAFAHFARF
ncbi:MAG: 30S ribosomal protein S7 [Patescibacteria group bacterium]